MYKPSDKDKKELKYVYDELEKMIAERHKTWRQFNDRTLIQFIDDSEKRVQGYVPPRESQGKQEWQSNVFNQATRNKLKALVASVASSPPDLIYKAVKDKDGGLDLYRAEIMENLVVHSRGNTNQEVEIFWDSWNCVTKGTVVKYDGYFKGKYPRKFITSYDPITGDMEFDEREFEIDEGCVELNVPLTEFFISDFTIHDVQDQPAVAWVRYLNKSDIKMEFGKYKNYKFIETNSQVQNYTDETVSFFYNKWKDRVEEDEYEVIKFYSIADDKYCVVVNGVLLLSAPLLWGRKKKMYPFAKTIFEPFSSKEFFYGNSLPNANMDVQDVINTLYNMSLDKTYRSLNPPLLVGVKNKDLVELENENIGMESTLYVEDINQVKYMDSRGLTDAEFGIIKWVSQGIDLGTLDINQQGVAGRGVTAREIVISNENAKRIKGLFFMFLTDLWIQKTKLRIFNVLINYTLPKLVEVVGEYGATTMQETFRDILVENSKFPDGSRGTLAIKFVNDREELPSPEDLDLEEEKYKIQGVNYQKIVLTSDYLDNFEYDVQVVSKTLFQKDSAEAQAVLQEKLGIMATFFPQIFMANMQTIFKDFVRAYNEDPEKYNLESPMQLPMEGIQEEMGGGGQPPLTQNNLPALSQLSGTEGRSAER